MSSTGKNWMYGLDKEYDKIKNILNKKKLKYIEIDFKNFSFSYEEINNLDFIFSMQNGSKNTLSYTICKYFDFDYKMIEEYGLETYLSLNGMQKGQPIRNGAGKIFELFYRVFAEAKDDYYILCKNLSDSLHYLIKKQLTINVRKIVNVNFIATINDPKDPIILENNCHIIDVD